MVVMVVNTMRSKLVSSLILTSRQLHRVTSRQTEKRRNREKEGKCVRCCSLPVELWGSGIACWLERRTRDRKVPSSNPEGAAGEFSSSS